MNKIRFIKLSDAEQLELEKGYCEGKSHAFRKRCQTILLKSEGRCSKEVGAIVKMHQVSVNAWLDRYETEGISGLLTKPGRGRKPILSKAQDEAAIKQAVESNRGSIKSIKAALSGTHFCGKGQFSDETLRRFLKVLTADI